MFFTIIKMPYKNYYQILGVNKDASQEEIKAAYRNLSKKYHPDLNNGDPEAEKRFKEINEAYQALNRKNNHSRFNMNGNYRTRWDNMVRNFRNDSLHHEQDLHDYIKELEEIVESFIKEKPNSILYKFLKAFFDL